MASNCSPDPQLASATALVELLTTHPELTALTWTCEPIGILRGQQTADSSAGRIVDDCAEILGGTPVRARLTRGDDCLGVVELATVWHGVPVEVWASYPAAPPRRLPLGLLVAPIAGGAR